MKGFLAGDTGATLVVAVYREGRVAAKRAGTASLKFPYYQGDKVDKVDLCKWRIQQDRWVGKSSGEQGTDFPRSPGVSSTRAYAFPVAGLGARPARILCARKIPPPRITAPTASSPIPNRGRTTIQLDGDGEQRQRQGDDDREDTDADRPAGRRGTAARRPAPPTGGTPGRCPPPSGGSRPDAESTSWWCSRPRPERSFPASPLILPSRSSISESPADVLYG